jgi:GWxTD domain-containing protein
VTLRSLIVVLGALVGAPAGPQSTPSVEVAAVRFVRGDATLVQGFCRVPFALLTPVAGTQEGVYRVDVVVRDSSGTLLHESGWSQSVSAGLLAVAGASTVEQFAFAVPEGRYQVMVSVADSTSGRAYRSRLDISAFPARAQLSDLLVSSAMRRDAEADAVAGPGELQLGSYFVSASPKPVLMPRQPQLHYYVELYPRTAATVTMTARVLDGEGRTLTETAAQELSASAAGGVTARTLDLTGLPQGEYRLELAVRFPDGEVVRSAPFSVAGFETEQQIAELTVGQELRDPFAEMVESQLDSLYAPLVYLMESDERGIYEGLSIDGKRNYLRQFWAKRDPTPGTPTNESYVAFYQLFEEANRRFRQSGAGRVAGWRTDQGRVFLKRGAPEEVLSRPMSGDTPPFEAWKYTRPRPLKYVFLDQSGLGDYRLIYTDDRLESSRGDWQEQLGPRAVEDVLRF